MSFSGDIRRFTEKAAEAHNKITRVATLELFRGVILDTPVLSGRARGNWQVSVGAPVTGELEREDKSGSTTMADAERGAPPGAGQVTYLANNLPYIEELENGSSKKSPEGMVRKNVDRVQKMVDAAVRKNRV